MSKAPLYKAKLNFLVFLFIVVFQTKGLLLLYKKAITRIKMYLFLKIQFSFEQIQILVVLIIHTC